MKSFDEAFLDELDSRVYNIMVNAYEMGFEDGKIVGDTADIVNVRKYKSGKDFADNVFKAANTKR